MSQAKQQSKRFIKIPPHSIHTIRIYQIRICQILDIHSIPYSISIQDVLIDNWTAYLDIICSSTYQKRDITVLSLATEDDPSHVLAEKWKSSKKSSNGSFPT